MGTKSEFRSKGTIDRKPGFFLIIFILSLKLTMKKEHMNVVVVHAMQTSSIEALVLNLLFRGIYFYFPG